jgi:hypothetical protein
MCPIGHERIEALGIASTYLVGMNESGNQKVNLSYLAGTKKRPDSVIQLIFHKRGARADEENDARALFLSGRRYYCPGHPAGVVSFH